MHFSLKNYQADCLKVLQDYLVPAREKGAKGAFNESESEPRDEFGRPRDYAVIPAWADSEAFPYVCLRVPTGGGKTIIAAHAVGVATKSSCKRNGRWCCGLRRRGQSLRRRGGIGRRQHRTGGTG